MSERSLKARRPADRKATATDIGSTPILVSLHTPDDYYAESADLLRADCERLGIDHDIVEIEKSPDDDWLSICRRKVSFYLEMQRKHRRPMLWLDVDWRIGAWPRVLDGLGCDIAGFLRGLKYLRDFDPVSNPRFFAPSALYFNCTPRATAFLECMADLERIYTGQATDDYFLEEAWLQHRQQMSVTILPPDLVGDEWPLPEGRAFYQGVSGNVTSFRARAEQHTAAELAPKRRKAVLLHEAGNARKAGRIDDAIVLYRHAQDAAERDDALARKIARLMRQHGRKTNANALEPGGETGSDSRGEGCAPPAPSRQGFWRRWR